MVPADKVQRACARFMMRDFGKWARPRTFLAQTGVKWMSRRVFWSD